MVDAPQQNWPYYNARAQASDAEWLRAMTPAERFAVYADVFNTLWVARQKVEGNWVRLDQQRWESKLAMRLRMVDAFAKLDEMRRERATANDPR